MGILDRPTLPDWLERFHAINDLADEGASLHYQAKSIAQARSGTIDFGPVEAWYAKIRGIGLPDEAAKKFEQEVSSLDAYVAKHLTPPNVDASGPWGFANGFQRVVVAVREGGGALVRGLGEDAVMTAIVGYLYRLDSQRHDIIIDLRYGGQFGIDDNQLARLVSKLVRDDIFDARDAPDSVVITEHGRDWFAREMAALAKGAQPAATEEEDSDSAWSARSDHLDVDEVTKFLSFMESAELRGYVLDDLREVNDVFGVGADLSTMILCGSAVEGMVLDIAEQLPGKLTVASKPNWADSISLPKIVDELHTLGLLTDTTQATTLRIADHRDLVHHNRRRKAAKKIVIDPSAAKAMMLLVELVARDLHEAEKSGAIAKLK